MLSVDDSGLNVWSRFTLNRTYTIKIFIYFGISVLLLLILGVGVIIS